MVRCVIPRHLTGLNAKSKPQVWDASEDWVYFEQVKDLKAGGLC